MTLSFARTSLGTPWCCSPMVKLPGLEARACRSSATDNTVVRIQVKGGGVQVKGGGVQVKGGSVQLKGGGDRQVKRGW